MRESSFHDLGIAPLDPPTSGRAAIQGTGVVSIIGIILEVEEPSEARCDQPERVKSTCADLCATLFT